MVTKTFRRWLRSRRTLCLVLLVAISLAGIGVGAAFQDSQTAKRVGFGEPKRGKHIGSPWKTSTTTSAPTSSTAVRSTLTTTTASSSSTSSSSTSTTGVTTTGATTSSTTTRATTTSTASSTTTRLQTTTTATGSTASGLNKCGLAGAVFCESFDSVLGGGTRTGDLDPVLWGVSRVGLINPGDGGVLNGVPQVSMAGCGTSGWVFAPADVRVCDGKMFETVNDGGGVTSLHTYPKQPFNFAGRTGKVVFDVSADSDGSHGAWPEFVITDKPVPGIRRLISVCCPPRAVHEVGFSLDGTSAGSSAPITVGTVWVSRNGVYDEVPFSVVGSVRKGSLTALNHFEVRLSTSRMEVWGTDPGGGPLKQLVIADNLGLTFSQGLVWLNDAHYNARKAVEPCGCGTQWNHTFAWDNLAFDGPKTYRDLGFDVPDANRPGSPSEAGDPTIVTGYRVGTGPMSLTVPGVRRDQAPTGALVVLNTYSFAATIPSVSINGGPFIDTPWPSWGDTWLWQSIAIPVPVDQIRDGANTLTFKSADPSTTLANISIILVAGAPVP